MQILEINTADADYIFNGETLELFVKEDQKEYNDYLNSVVNSAITYKIRNNSNILAKVTLNISNSCNLKCQYCYASFGTYGRASNLMSIHTVDKIINEIKQRGFKEIKTVAFFGGEPLLNIKTIKYAVDQFDSNFVKIGNYEVTTNSLLLTNSIIDFFNEHKVKLVLSVDGPKDITDYLRGKGVYDSVIGAIKYAQSIGYKDLETAATYTKKHLDMGYSFNDIKNFLKI